LNPRLCVQRLPFDDHRRAVRSRMTIKPNVANSRSPLQVEPGRSIAGTDIVRRDAFKASFPEGRSWAHLSRYANGGFVRVSTRSQGLGKVCKGSKHKVAALQPAARGASGAVGDNLRSQ